jgi:heme/copper-type cytochrome/quinol oxidase subunit 2
MRTTVHVVTPARFHEWIKAQMSTSSTASVSATGGSSG